MIYFNRCNDILSLVVLSFLHHRNIYRKRLFPRGAHWPRKGVWGCAEVMAPFFSGQSALPRLPIYHHCTALVPPPLFSNFWKNFHFQPCFGQNFNSQDANFPNFRSQDPSFFKENPLPRPYFWKPVWHTPTKKKKKKKLSAPRIISWCKMFRFGGVARLFKMRGRQGGLRGERGEADRDSKWRLSIDLCTKCNFIWGARGGAEFLTRGGGCPPPAPLWLRHWTVIWGSSQTLQNNKYQFVNRNVG